MFSFKKWNWNSSSAFATYEYVFSTVRFSENDILKVIQKLDPIKAHGNDKKSTRMLKLSNKAICTHLHMIFTSCLETGVFPIHWKKGNVVPIHKKES